VAGKCDNETTHLLPGAGGDALIIIPPPQPQPQCSWQLPPGLAYNKLMFYTATVSILIKTIKLSVHWGYTTKQATHSLLVGKC